MKVRIVVLCFLAGIFACKTDAVDIKMTDLDGFWEVASAKRNGNPTSLLDGGYFYFSKVGTLATNIKGDTLSSNFALEGNIISVEADDQLKFKVNYISGDTINLSSKIGKSNFEFIGIKPKINIQ